MFRAVPFLVLCGVLMSIVACAEPSQPTLELVQTWPVEVPTLQDPQMRDAHVVWIEMIESARETIDLAHFYASNAPDSRLERVIGALENAAQRGVAVRFLAEEKFYETYPETLERLDAMENVVLRRYDVAKLMGGVLHAKYLLVDRREVCVGSQNFDFRALEHILELGVRTNAPEVARAYADVFSTDWQLAEGGDPAFRVEPASPYQFPETVLFRDAPTRVTPVFSPEGWLVDERLWDLPRLLEAIQSARERIRVQLLSYHVESRNGEDWRVLDDALRAAAARGVEVQLLVSNWNTRAHSLPGLKDLQRVDGITVRFATIPQWSGGFIPFARVIHAKCMTVDGRIGWVGTSNWQRGYFHDGRNAGLILEGDEVVAALDAFFVRTWNDPVSQTIDPDREYPAPRVGE